MNSQPVEPVNYNSQPQSPKYEPTIFESLPWGIIISLCCAVLFIYFIYSYVKQQDSEVFEEPEIYQDGTESNEPEFYQDEEEEPEPFNNDLPNENVKLTEDNNQYSEDSLPLMALDQSVIQQHNKYVTERNKVTSTASFQPSRSDTQDVVPFVGLRRPSYSVNGKDLVDETARTVPTELDADQLAKPTQIYWK